MPPSLASRLLFPSGASSPPPPLVGSPELTAEVYDVIALALRAYVSPWWAKLTRYDRDLLPHVATIVAHVIRVLDARIQAQDLAPLVFNDIPAILTQHYADYRNAQAKLHTAYAAGGAASLHTLFAGLQPHMAVSPNGTIDREYYRQIFDRVLAVTLPEEDWDAEAERILIREVLLRLLVDDILPKITQPWFIQSTLLDLVGEPPAPPLFAPPPPAAFSYHALVVLALSALQAFSGFCLALIDAYKHTLRLVQHPPPSAPLKPTPPPAPSTAPPPAPSLASAHSTTSSVSSAPGSLPLPPSPTLAPPTPAGYAHPPLLLLGTLLGAPTPTLAASATLHTLHVLAALLTPLLDRLLPAALAAFLSPARVLSTVRAAKRTFFPNGYPAPAPPDPTPDEQAALRARVVALRPPPGVLALLAPLLLGPDPAATLGAALDPLSDAQCNLRLAVFLLDRVLLGLFPELAGAP